jgi:DNA-binding response OmpR family regulator
MRALVTGDEEILATTVTAGPRREGTAVDVPPDGAAALEHPAVSRYDLTRLTFSGSPPRPHP